MLSHAFTRSRKPTLSSYVVRSIPVEQSRSFHFKFFTPFICCRDCKYPVPFSMIFYYLPLLAMENAFIKLAFFSTREWCLRKNEETKHIFQKYILCCRSSSLCEFVRPNRMQQIIEVRSMTQWHLHIIVVYYDAIVITILLVIFCGILLLLVLSWVVTTITLLPVSFNSFPFLCLRMNWLG